MNSVDTNGGMDILMPHAYKTCKYLEEKRVTGHDFINQVRLKVRPQLWMAFKQQGLSLQISTLRSIQMVPKGVPHLADV